MIRVFVGVLIGLPIVTLIATQGPVATWIVARVMRAQFGANFTADWVSLKPDGRLVVTKMALDVPGMSGPEARVLSAERVEVAIEWAGFAGVSSRPKEVTITQPVIRASLGPGGETNLSRLLFPKGAGQTASLPLIRVDRGALEFSEHSPDAASAADRFRMLARAEVSGTIAPTAAGAQTYRVEFSQVGGMPLGSGGRGVQVGGRVNLSTGEAWAEVSGLDLSKWTPDRVPSEVRETWTKMAMSGSVSKTEFRLTRDGAVEVTISTENVGLRVPVPAGQRELVGERFATMTGVSGTIRFFQGVQHSGIEAELKGKFEEEVDCSVSFHSEGVTLDAPYSATIQANDFEMDPNLRVWWLAPQSVREILQMFSGPTAKVDALINIRRAAGTAALPSEPEISGSVKFENGSAAFEPFPYRINRLSGDVRFSALEVTIDRVSGTGAAGDQGGGTLIATGRFAPPTDEASVDVKVDLYDLPFDAKLQEAIDRSGGRDMIKALFSRERYGELLSRGLITSPEEWRRLGAMQGAGVVASQAGGAGAPAGAAAARLAFAPSAPVFELGGPVSEVKIRVHRPFGLGQEYSYDIDVMFDEVALLPEIFAFPLIGRQTRLMLRNQMAELKSEQLMGLQGGSAAVEAIVQSQRMPGGESSYIATVYVSADDVPVTPLLINAVPDDAARALGRASASPASPALDEGPALSPQRLLRDLGISGLVDCTAVVRPRALDEVKFSVDVSFDGLSARPTGQPSGDAVWAEGVSGSVNVTQDGLTILPLTGRLYREAAPEAELAAGPPRDSGAFALEGSTRFGSEEGGAELSARLSTMGLDIGAPMERFVRAMSAEAGDLVASLRERVNPEGRMDADIAVQTIAPGPADPPGTPTAMGVSLAVNRVEDLRFDAMNTRMGVKHHRGRVKADLVRGAPATEGVTNLTFEDFQAELSAEGERAGTIRVDGTASVRTGEGEEPPELLIRRPLRGFVAGAALESPLVRRLIGMTAGERTLAIVRDIDLRGLFEADFDMKPSPAPDSAGRDWSLRAVVWPQMLSLSTDEVSVFVPEVRGRLTIEEDGGTVDGLQLLGGEWTITADGAWTLTGEGDERRLRVEMGLWFDADDATPTLLAMTPGVVRTALRELRLTSPGGLHMQDARLLLSADEGGLDDLDFRGELELHRASANVGVELGELTGTLGVSLRQKRGEPSPAIALDLAAQSLRAAGVDVREARASAKLAGADAAIELTSFGGACYGGRISGAAVVWPPRREGEARRYGARVQVGGVRVADMLVALRRNAGEESSALAGGALGGAAFSVHAGLPVQEPTGDERRGWMDAELAITGSVGDERDRQGRGALRITGGDVLDMPLAVRLIQVGNLQLPLGETLDYFQAAFWMNGRNVKFDQLGLLSDSLAIMGTGELTLPEMDLDLTIHSQSRMRLPVLSDLFEIVRNELITARVTGRLDDPAIGAEPLRGTRALLGGLLGAPLPEDPSAQRSQLERERSRAPWTAATAEPQR